MDDSVALYIAIILRQTREQEPSFLLFLSFFELLVCAGIFRYPSTIEKIPRKPIMLIYRVFSVVSLLPLLATTQALTAQDNSFRPSSGEQILANVTYFIQWSFVVPFTSCIGIEFDMADEVPPDYTTSITVVSRQYLRRFGLR
jgi:hypothetical protein